MFHFFLNDDCNSYLISSESYVMPCECEVLLCESITKKNAGLRFQINIRSENVRFAQKLNITLLLRNFVKFSLCDMFINSAASAWLELI